MASPPPPCPWSQRVPNGPNTSKKIAETFVQAWHMLLLWRKQWTHTQGLTKHDCVRSQVNLGCFSNCAETDLPLTLLRKLQMWLIIISMITEIVESSFAGLCCVSCEVLCAQVQILNGDSLVENGAVWCWSWLGRNLNFPLLCCLWCTDFLQFFHKVRNGIFGQCTLKMQLTKLQFANSWMSQLRFVALSGHWSHEELVNSFVICICFKIVAWVMTQKAPWLDDPLDSSHTGTLCTVALSSTRFSNENCFAMSHITISEDNDGKWLDIDWKCTVTVGTIKWQWQWTFHPFIVMLSCGIIRFGWHIWCEICKSKKLIWHCSSALFGSITSLWWVCSFVTQWKMFKTSQPLIPSPIKSLVGVFCHVFCIFAISVKWSFKSFKICPFDSVLWTSFQKKVNTDFRMPLEPSKTFTSLQKSVCGQFFWIRASILFLWCQNVFPIDIIIHFGVHFLFHPTIHGSQRPHGILQKTKPGSHLVQKLPFEQIHKQPWKPCTPIQSPLHPPNGWQDVQMHGMATCGIKSFLCEKIIQKLRSVFTKFVSRR